MVYIFINNEDEYVGEAETWDPESGENAVIIKTINRLENSLSAFEGPTIEEKYEVNLHFQTEPRFVSEIERSLWDDNMSDEYTNAIIGDKIGGAPFFIQADDFPEGEGWKLLLQIDSPPFYINFGDGGIGFVFINKDYTQGKFLWQCH